ncbi:MAG: hypothetical protein AAB518_00660 [Patescibacteria group bacterium]
MRFHPHIFKAYDARGKYPSEINETVVIAIARGLMKFWGGGKVIVGHDARLSSPELYRAMVGSLKRSGVKGEVIAGGLMTSPMLYFLVNHLKAKGGIMITASHNPKEWNGVKAVGKGAAPISGEELKRLVL